MNILKNAIPRASLVTMPFGPLYIPSLALGLLKSAALQQGYNCKIRYSTFRFANLLGWEAYQRMEEGFPSTTSLAGEWIFSGLLPGRNWREKESYFDWVRTQSEFSRCYNPAALLIELEKVLIDVERAICLAEEFIEAEVKAILADQPQVVGFTSVFQQTVASLATAWRIKQREPDIIIVFGGANCEQPMGEALLDSYEFIDAVVDGEGETAFINLLRQIKSNKPLQSAGNLVVRKEVGSPIAESYASKEEVYDLQTANLLKPQELLPDFEEYFNTLNKMDWREKIPVHLPFETSRGCWWGAKQHCTFCGLNGKTMQFRSKPPELAAQQLKQLINLYGKLPVDMTDNIIDFKYLDSFVPTVAEMKLGVSIFYETKANLTREQLKKFADAGINRLQPGIESLTDETLRLMRKGVTAVQNIQLMKWCKEFGIQVSWNYLWGFPGESPEQYDAIAEIIPFLVHLPPPNGGSSIRLDRFSPYFNEPKSWGLTNLQPYESYSYVFDLPPRQLEKIAYYFTFDYETPQDINHYTSSLVRKMDIWFREHKTSELVFVDQGEEILIIDTRASTKRAVIILDSQASNVLRSCWCRTTRTQLIQEAFHQGGKHQADSVTSAIDVLVANGIILEWNGSLLSLAMSLQDYSPQGEGLARIIAAIQSESEPVRGGDELIIERQKHLLMH